MRYAVLSFLVALALPFALTFAGEGAGEATKPAAMPASDRVDAISASYIGSAACAGCHAEVEAEWATSDHAKAWTEASPDTILADFNNTAFAHDGMTARFRVEPDGSHHIEITEKDGATRDYPVHSVVGIEPLQQYLLETEPGRLQSFDVVWDTKKGGWFHLYPDQDLPPSDGLHWTGPYKNWNGRCAVCHATGYEKNYDPSTDSYSSAYEEIGVGCETCHGKGSTHVAWAEEWEATGATPPANYGFAVDVKNREEMLSECAGCHSRREPLEAGSPEPDSGFHNNHNLSLLMPGLYFPDGQIQDEVYVYGSFLQSKMYAKGVTCSNCHNPHTTDLVADGNDVCTQCHSPAGNPEFPSLSHALYDDPSHTHHPMGSEGAQCKNCHMVERVYMGNDWRADHSFRVPRPDLNAVTGAPDACTTCHEDKDAAWAAAEIAAWYPDSAHRGARYGEAFAAARKDPAAAAPALVAIALDGAQPAIVRATALALLGRGTAPDVADMVAPLLEDPDPLVRAAAVDTQRSLAQEAKVARIAPLLSDPSKNVRVAAARALIGVPAEAFASDDVDALREAAADYRVSLANRADFPETQMQLAGLALTNKQWDEAMAAFAEATEMDPQLVQAWVMQVRIAAATQGQAAAEAVLGKALAANPADATLNAYRYQLSGR